MRVDKRPTSESHKRMAHNQQFLKSVVSCLEFCGRQGISLRGHRNDSGNDDQQTMILGNFKALVNFRISAGDAVLDSHLKECSKRSTYTSKTTQNELLTCIEEVIQKDIVAEVLAQSDKTQPFFGVHADEVTDILNW